ncbi:MAG TPA: hypothetical protein HA252_04975 [Candidatus Diapherotrites archaeon]|uniref:Helix-turn-helix domain-containing protein n=1 Tax=Candidatus Iainarchaeum sp. TaxID=3101447 RepID=A0A7J4JG52_9ARCH|nr:hypothetical protein [Candidatus Diapherotrites archaeon]HIH16732.1 hypothetical protein [Candidatus Diapherotrites archaeon]
MIREGYFKSRALMLVFEALATVPDASPVLIRQLTGLPERTTRHSLARLARLGLLQTVPDYSDLRAKKFKLNEPPGIDLLAFGVPQAFQQGSGHPLVAFGKPGGSRG